MPQNSKIVGRPRPTPYTTRGPSIRPPPDEDDAPLAAVAEAAPASPPAAAAAAAVAVPPPSWDWRKAAARSLLAARSWARSALDTSFRTGAADKLRLAAAHAAVRAATQDALESMVRQDTFAVLWWPPAVGRLITHWVAAYSFTFAAFVYYEYPRRSGGPRRSICTIITYITYRHSPVYP